MVSLSQHCLVTIQYVFIDVSISLYSVTAYLFGICYKVSKRAGLCECNSLENCRDGR